MGNEARDTGQEQVEGEKDPKASMDCQVQNSVPKWPGATGGGGEWALGKKR